MARRALRELLADRDDIQLETVDVLASPGRTLRDGIRMIPALRSDQSTISGILLSKDKIAAFLDQSPRG